METGREQPLAERLARREIERRGLRPAVAASVIAAFWVVAIVVFGIGEHLLDSDTFGSIWQGMWWSAQTVTTVGYGDVVPDSAVGRALAGVLMVGGLSLFAVITGVVTSAFVARAQAEGLFANEVETEKQLAALTAELGEVRAALGRLEGRSGGSGPPLSR